MFQCEQLLVFGAFGRAQTHQLGCLTSPLGHEVLMFPQGWQTPGSKMLLLDLLQGLVPSLWELPMACYLP